MSTYIDGPEGPVTRRGPIGRRIQINVTDRQLQTLRVESARTGLPVSELIRRAIDATYRPGTRVRLRGLEISLGVFREPDAAVAGRRRRKRARLQRDTPATNGSAQARAGDAAALARGDRVGEPRR
jgi:hypothetical protein